MPVAVYPDNETQRLSALRSLQILDTSSEERFDRITRIAMQVFDVPFACISLIDADRQWFKSAPGFDKTETNRADAFCAHTILNDSPLIIEDTLQHPLLFDSALVTEQPGIRFYAGISIKLDSGFNIGALCILDTRPKKLTSQQIQLLTEMAKLVESELEQLELLQTTAALTQSKQQLQQLSEQLYQSEQHTLFHNQVMELIAHARPLKRILTSIVSGIETTHKDMICSILLLDSTGKHLTIGAAVSLPEFYNDAIEGLPIGETIGSCGSAAYTGKRVIAEDIATHPYWQPFTQLARRANLGSCWSEPIIGASGRVLGTFAIYHRDRRAPSPGDINLVEQTAYLASISIERDNANKLIRQQACFDSLTGLPNRDSMMEQLKQALLNADQISEKVTLIYLDLDNFKEINDSLGHDTGDALLIECADRISSCLQGLGVAAKLSGDEFTITLTKISDLNAIEQFVRKIQTSLSQPFQLQQKMIEISTSIGVSVSPDDGTNLERLFKNVDLAMYRAKRQEGNSYQFFHESMYDETVRRQSLINDLRVAIEKEQFYLVYQPIINLVTGKITKVEALIRWQHPERGHINPLDFIPLAEETGLIVQLGNWVFHQALLQAKIWRAKYDPRFQISINTSPVQYKSHHGGMLNWLKCFKNNEFNPHSVVMEITESMLMESQDSVTDILTQFRHAGIEISIDDFGTGYSSLSYLKKFPIDYLKIDKSFVWQMSPHSDDSAICEAIITMAKRLGIKVIAEGIETREQKHLLQSIGCDYGQGYLLSRPLPASELENLLMQQPLLPSSTYTAEAILQ